MVKTSTAGMASAPTTAPSRNAASLSVRKARIYAAVVVSTVWGALYTAGRDLGRVGLLARDGVVESSVFKSRCRPTPVAGLLAVAIAAVVLGSSQVEIVERAADLPDAVWIVSARPASTMDDRRAFS